MAFELLPKDSAYHNRIHTCSVEEVDTDGPSVGHRTTLVYVSDYHNRSTRRSKMKREKNKNDQNHGADDAQYAMECAAVRHF